MKLHLLGTRGSMPTGGPEFIKYGSDTSSYLIETQGEGIFLDGGSGILKAPPIAHKKISVFLSHVHLDHILGLPFFPLLKENIDIDIYSHLPGFELEQIMNRIFGEPFWPINLTDYKANVNFYSLLSENRIGDTKITWEMGNHPGEAVIYRIENQGKSIVYATDYEHDGEDRNLIRMAENADILIYDGQYAEEEYPKFKGFGHSTKERGLEIKEKSGAKKIIFTHHDPRHTDDYLASEEERINVLCPYASFAKAGEVMEI